MAQQTLKAIKGMNDILPEEADRWLALEKVVGTWLKDYGYRNIRTPIVEDTGLFKRAIGEVTDIVEKEMYSFTDSLNGDSLTLRPEGTAACLRAVIEHNLLYNGPQRLWYSGQMFRHERPQKGRYRQFHQIGVEALGFNGPDSDAELLVMTADLWQRLGLKGLQLQINTLGSSADRLVYRERLIAYLEQHQDVLDEEAKRRLYSNPLRVLDSKNPAMQAVIEAAPKLWDDLCEESRAHFAGVERLLKASNIDYVINHRLVRGLDYYNYTVFEWVTTELGAQGTVCAGGRYDGLIEQLGGKPNPAAGFGIGIERLLLLLEAQGYQAAIARPDVYLVCAGDESVTDTAFIVSQQLRRAGISTVLHCGGGSFKSQFKKADASGATWALVMGESEAAKGEVTLKSLRMESQQETLTIAAAIERIKK